MSDIIRETYDWLLQCGRDVVGDTVLIPTGAKKPIVCHKEPGQWSMEKAHIYMVKNPEHAQWGLLLDSLCVVDADSDDAVAKIEALQDPDVVEALSVCPIQQTNKGRHYLFIRPEWADAEGYWDGARQVIGFDADLKTRCSTGTRGVLAICPSLNKTWVREPWAAGTKLVDIPRTLMELVAKPKQTKQKKQRSIKVVVNDDIDHESGAPEAFDEVAALVDIIAASRASSYRTWMEVGWCLHNISPTHLPLWELFSKKCPEKYTKGKCGEVWGTMNSDDRAGLRLRLRLGSLHMWARHDSPVEYWDIVNDAMRIPGIIKDNWDNGDYGLGQIAHFLLQGSVKKTGKGCSDYFIFEEDTCRWAKVDEGRVKSVVVEAMEEALRDVDLWIATQSAQRRLQGGDAKMRVANLDLKKREVVSLIRLMLASSRIRRCSGHGDFKTATRALLVLLETATPYAVSPVIMRKASKGVARMLQYYNDITTELTLDMNGVACLIASMPTVFLSAALNACGRQVSIGTDKVSPQFHQLYTDMFIRTCNERTQEHCHLVGLVSLFIATRSQSQMLAVIDALSQDGLGNLFRLLAELPAKIPIPCIDVFIHVANECVATAHLPAGVEDLFIRSAIAILLDNETAGATVASISKTMLRVAIADPAYAQAMATALEPHMAVAPTLAVEFKPSIDRISTAMGIRILLSSSFGYSHMVTMTNFGIGYLACVYPQHRWVNGDDDMHCWMLFYE
eukprot:gene11709-biopygen15870